MNSRQARNWSDKREALMEIHLSYYNKGYIPILTCRKRLNLKQPFTEGERYRARPLISQKAGRKNLRYLTTDDDNISCEVLVTDIKKGNFSVWFYKPDDPLLKDI
jgi:hypothetical protein